MSEIVNFVNRGAASITPAIMEKVLRQLPQWKLEFTQIYAPLFPHLVDQLEFLADAVEDTGEGVYKDLPYFALAEAVFALIYAHKKVGIIPDSVLNLGRAQIFGAPEWVVLFGALLLELDEVVGRVGSEVV